MLTSVLMGGVVDVPLRLSRARRLCELESRIHLALVHLQTRAYRISNNDQVL